MSGWSAPRAHQRDGFSGHALKGGRPRRVTLYILLVDCLVMLVTAGCTALGPAVLKGERLPYNSALRGRWFYLDDTDLRSNSPFSLLSQLFALQAGKTERLLPLLTLPLGR